MPSASTEPTSPPVRILALAGLAGLAALTVATPGATRMYSSPWTAVFAAVLVVPVALLLLQVARARRPFRLPAPTWLSLAAATATVPLASALASPYRGPSLLAAATPAAAAALFLVLHDWLAAGGPERAQAIRSWWAGFALVLAGVSFGLWLRDMSGLTSAQLFSRTAWNIRNPHPLGHSNYTAGLMLLGLPVLATLGWQRRGPSRLLFLGGAGLALVNLLTSGSRGGLLGFAALLIAGAAVSGLGWRRFALLAGAALAATVVLAVTNPRVRDMLRPPDPAAEPNLSNDQRSAMLQAGLELGRSRPLLGWGLGTTPLAFPRYRHTLDGGAENVLQLHSTPVQLWAETGALGLLAGAAAVTLAFVRWRRSPLAAATLAGYAVFALTDYQLDVPVFAAAVAMLGALLAAPAASPASGRTRALVGLSAGVGLLLIGTLGERDPAPALNVRALALARNPTRHAEAVALLRESLALNPDQEIAHFNLGWLLLVPDPAAAERHFLVAAHFVPDKGGVYFGLGLARLNQGKSEAAARAFALECLNEPLFLASPWWNLPVLAAQRDATAAAYRELASRALAGLPAGSWAAAQARHLRDLAPRLGVVPPGPERNYRRERIGYPVLMRNLDLPVPVDLYDVRESPGFAESIRPALPSKGWLPAPLLLKLLGESVPP